MEFISKHKIELLFSFLGISLSIVLNQQFLEGSNINHTIAGHDEYIAVKEVYSILDPLSFKHFVMAIISGNALYYGRIMFYLDALLAWLPFKIWGISGMVFAIRMAHTLALYTALVILAHTFLEKQWQKLLFFLSVVCMYHTLYFITMPKPEPWQLLFLALFLKRFKRSGWSFGLHFIFLGIAYGLKFNVLLILPIVFALPFIKQAEFHIKENVKPALLSVIYTLSGIVIAVPCLILSPLRPVFLKAYLHETFGSTEKTYDDAGISFYDWFSEGFGMHYLGHSLLAFLFFTVLIVLLFQQFRNYKLFKDPAALLLMCCGSILMLVIMIKTKRMWPHYLWTGVIFTLIGVLNGMEPYRKLKWGKLAFSALVFLSVFPIYSFAKSHLPLYLNLDKREDVVLNHRNSSLALEYLKSKPGKFAVATDGSVYYPFKDYVATDLYNPFEFEVPESADKTFFWYTDAPEKIWDLPNQYVVFYLCHPERMLKENTEQYQGRHEELYKLYQEQIQSNFTRDTAFGPVVIYKRR